mgnify:CR=1 FL=1
MDKLYNKAIKLGYSMYSIQTEPEFEGLLKDKPEFFNVKSGL